MNFGNASPKPAVASSGPFPRAMPDGACGATVGLYSRRSRTEAAFTGLRPAPHPVAALGLSVALGRDPAVAPTPHAPAVNRYVGRVTSLEKLYPDVWLTFNTLCKQSGGWIESRQGANDPSLSPIVRCPENLTPCRAWGFRICGTAKRGRILHVQSQNLQTQALHEICGLLQCNVKVSLDFSNLAIQSQQRLDVRLTKLNMESC